MSPERVDVIVVGAGLAGLVAAAEIADAGKRVLILDQEGEQSLGGQAHWSLGGLFMVDTPEQRRLRITDSYDLALADWMGTASFDRPEDHWPRRWAEAYVAFAAGEKRAWLTQQGVRFFPIVGWAERGGQGAWGHGNSVPRFHLAWGTGPGVLAPFIRRVHDAAKTGRVTFRFRHRVEALEVVSGVVTGVAGQVLAPTDVARGQASAQAPVADFACSADAVIVASGGIGGNPDLVRAHWPARLGAPPARMISGVPAHVDGKMLGVAEAAGASLVNRDRMWHYVEGIHNHSPIWPNHAIRILPGPSSLWFDARGRRLPAPFLPGFDTLGTLAHLRASGYDHSWFVLTHKVIAKEFALSGSEQNPDITSQSWRQVITRATSGIPGPVRAFMERGVDFIVERDVGALVARMNALVGETLLDASHIEREIAARDAQLDNPFCKDAQIVALRAARRYLGDRLIRTARPHTFLDPANGPLIAVRLSILTRKTLGGLHTDLAARVLRPDGSPYPGLFACGEAAGFGGGGMHGYRALEGTFLGGCLFSGRVAGRSASGAPAP